MNAKRRKEIIKISQEIELCVDKLRDVLDEEQDCYSNMPENLQGSDRGIESEEAQNCLEEAIESLEEAIITLEDIN